MEAQLVQTFPKIFDPDRNKLLRYDLKINGLTSLPNQFETFNSVENGPNIFLALNLSLMKEVELATEVYLCVVEIAELVGGSKFTESKVVS